MQWGLDCCKDYVLFPIFRQRHGLTSSESRVKKKKKAGTLYVKYFKCRSIIKPEPLIWIQEFDACQ